MQNVTGCPQLQFNEIFTYKYWFYAPTFSISQNSYLGPETRGCILSVHNKTLFDKLTASHILGVTTHENCKQQGVCTHSRKQDRIRKLTIPVNCEVTSCR